MAEINLDTGDYVIAVERVNSLDRPGTITILPDLTAYKVLQVSSHGERLRLQPIPTGATFVEPQWFPASSFKRVPKGVFEPRDLPSAPENCPSPKHENGSLQNTVFTSAPEALAGYERWTEGRWVIAQRESGAGEHAIHVGDRLQIVQAPRRTEQGVRFIAGRPRGDMPVYCLNPIDFTLQDVEASTAALPPSSPCDWQSGDWVEYLGAACVPLAPGSWIRLPGALLPGFAWGVRPGGAGWLLDLALGGVAGGVLVDTKYLQWRQRGGMPPQGSIIGLDTTIAEEKTAAARAKMHEAAETLNRIDGAKVIREAVRAVTGPDLESPTPPPPPWAQGLALYRAQLCPICGHTGCAHPRPDAPKSGVITVQERPRRSWWDPEGE